MSNDLMSTIKEASTAFKNRPAPVCTEEELMNFFAPFHKKVSDQVDLVYFTNLVSMDIQYGFIGGGMIGEKGGDISIG